jgi:hypothetical protein
MIQRNLTNVFSLLKIPDRQQALSAKTWDDGYVAIQLEGIGRLFYLRKSSSLLIICVLLSYKGITLAKRLYEAGVKTLNDLETTEPRYIVHTINNNMSS